MQQPTCLVLSTCELQWLQWRRNQRFRRFQWTGTSELLGPPSNGATEKFYGRLLRKIITIVATRWRILRLKCTKFDFGWGSAPRPRPRSRSLQFSPRPPSWFGGRFAAGGGGAGLGKMSERGGKGSGGREREGPMLLFNQGPSQPCYATEWLKV